MVNLIFINGAPGTGKSTTAKLLQKKLASPYIEFSDLREWHLLEDWSNQSQAEEEMSFNNLVFVLNNYIKNGYKNVIVTDLQAFRVRQISQLFEKKQYIIFTLVVSNDDVLKSRVLNETRDSGYKNYESAIEWNKIELERDSLPNEVKIDNTTASPEQVLTEIIRYIEEK